MRWRDVKAGDVIHWCSGKPYSKSWLIVATKPRGDTTLVNTLLNLDSGDVITDRRETDESLRADIWTVDRAGEVKP